MRQKLWEAICWVDAHRYEVMVGAFVVACLVGLRLTDKGLPD